MFNLFYTFLNWDVNFHSKMRIPSNRVVGSLFSKAVVGTLKRVHKVHVYTHMCKDYMFFCAYFRPFT